MEPTEKSIRFFIMMLTAFLARVKPASTIAKPACMKKTKKAAISIQTVSRDFALESVVGSSAKTPVAVKSKIKTIDMVNGVRLTFFTFPFPKPD